MGISSFDFTATAQAQMRRENQTGSRWRLVGKTSTQELMVYGGHPKGIGMVPVEHTEHLVNKENVERLTVSDSAEVPQFDWSVTWKTVGDFHIPVGVFVYFRIELHMWKLPYRDKLSKFSYSDTEWTINPFDVIMPYDVHSEDLVIVRQDDWTLAFIYRGILKWTAEKAAPYLSFRGRFGTSLAIGAKADVVQFHLASHLGLMNTVAT